jgi:hypothetical protein
VLVQAPNPRLARRQFYSRDGKKNRLQVNYGLMITRQGCPISVSVYEGNTAGTKTLMPQVSKLKESFVRIPAKMTGCFAGTCPAIPPSAGMAIQSR